MKRFLQLSFILISIIVIACMGFFFGTGVQAAGSLKLTSASSAYYARDVAPDLVLQPGTYELIRNNGDGWSIVKTSKGNRWVKPNYLHPSQSGSANANATSTTGVVTLKQDLNLRSGSSWSSPSLRVLGKGTKWKTYALQNGFYNLGGNQWLPSGNDFVTFTADKPTTPPTKPVDPPTSGGSTSVSGVVTLKQDLNLRSGSNWSSSSLRVLAKGSQWKVYALQNGFYNLGGSQWLPSGNEFVTFSKTGTTTPPVTPPVTKVTGTVTADVLNVRSGPGTSYGSVGTLYQNQEVTILNETNGWGQIERGTLKGYVSMAYISKNTGNTGGGNPNAGKGKIVVLDPGHGGATDDPGSISPINRLQEHQITWTYATKTKAELEKRGYDVYLSRTQTTACKRGASTAAELQCRIDVAKNKGAKIFVSIHANSADAMSARGTETYYNAYTSDDGNVNPYPNESRILAESVHNKIQPAFGSQDRFVRNSGFYVNRMAKVPSILIETGFLSNSFDVGQMGSATNQNNVAKAIADGIDVYFSKVK